MRINHNIQAMNTYRQMGVNQNAASQSMEKLSSGLRINRAGDDAAGLSISEKMRGQIRGLDQASRNAQDGISMIQTAEGALSETQSILQRMRELAVQASNDTNTEADRKEIQKEINQMNTEINRISDTTEFNTQKLLNGSMGATGTSSDSTKVQIDTLSGLKAGDYNFTVTQEATNAQLVGSVTYADDNAINTAFGATDKDITINSVQIDTTGATTGALLVDAINAKSDETGFTASWNATEGVTFKANEFGSGKSLAIAGADSGLIDNGNTNLTDGDDVSVTIGGPDQTVVVNGTGQELTYGNAEFTIAGATNDTATVTVDSSGASIHIGANKDQVMYLDMKEMSTSTLGTETTKIKDLNVVTSKGAESAIETLDAAIQQVSSERSKFGASQNRLEHTINNLNTSSENLSAAESRIRDVDMAKEMMNMTKENIKSQAAQAMLAQANQNPQQVLQLLR